MAGDLSPQDYAEHHLRAAQGYISGVLAGEVVVGRLVRAAVERHCADLVGGQYRGLHFSMDRADRVLRFFAYLRLWKGEWAGMQFPLGAWQAFILLCCFGWVRDDGTRRFRSWYLQVGRKNGKTAFAAGVGLYLMSADGEAAAEVYSVATKRDQAKITHRHAVNMRAKSPVLRHRIESYRDNLSIPSSASLFEPLGSNVDSADGLEAHATIVDEMHRHKSRDLWDVMETGQGSRRQPVMIGITTAGRDVSSFCYEQREHAERVLTGALQDDSFFAFVAEPDKGDDWRDRSTWTKGNPQLGVSLKVEKLEEEALKAEETPSARNNFRRYRLDQWVTGAADAWMDIDRWNACAAVKMALDGRACYGGLDLAATQDLSAFVLYFPATADDHRSHCLAFFWVPFERVAELEKQYRVPLESWIDDGWVVATEGNVIDYRYIRACITGEGGRPGEQTAPLARAYQIAEVAYDDWNSTQIVTELADDGLVMVPLPQTVKTYSSPMSRLRDEVKDGTLNHGANPVMRWMMSNVRACSDPSGREKPMKSEGKRRHKIDGPVALLMAIARAMIPRQPKRSVYETRGVVELDV